MDALIVRSVLIPGLMLALGRANWALPKSLDRVLPRLNVEGQGDVAPPDTGPPTTIGQPQAAPSG
jgi:RND superfamily putative drug exporter